MKSKFKKYRLINISKKNNNTILLTKYELLLYFNDFCI